MTARLKERFHPTSFIERLSNQRQALWLHYAMANRVTTAGIYLTIEYDEVAKALGYPNHFSSQFAAEVKSAVLLMDEMLGSAYLDVVVAAHPKTFIVASVLLLREWSEASNQDDFVDNVALEHCVSDYVLRMASVCYQWDNTRENVFDAAAWTQGAITVLEELQLPQVMELRIRNSIRNYCEAARPIEATATA